MSRLAYPAPVPLARLRDLDGMDPARLRDLAAEIRDFLVENVCATGGTWERTWEWWS